MKSATLELPTKKCREIAETCAGFSIRRAARVIANLYDEALAPSGLKGTQFSLLNALALIETATIGQLADRLLLDRTTLTRNLKPLEQKGLISMTRGSDPRTKGLSLTAKGATTLQSALPLWEQAQSAVEAILGRTKLARLRADLKTLEKLAP